MDSNQGVQFSDLLGEYDFNISTPVTFSSIFVDTIAENTIGNTVTFANTITSQNIIPDGDLTRNLGSPAKRFANAYLNTLALSSITAASLNLTGSVNQLIFGPYSGFTTTINLIPPTHNNVYNIPDVNAATQFILGVGAQTLDGKTFTNMVDIDITQRSSWPTITGTNVGMNKWTTDGNLYIDHGSGSAGGFAFRNNNGATTLLSVGNALLTSSTPVSVTNATQSTSISTGSIVTSGGIGVAKAVTTTDLTATNIIAAPGLTGSTNMSLFAPNGNFNFFSTAEPVYLQLGAAGAGDAVFGISSTANQWVTGSGLRDICIQTANFTQKVLMGINGNVYATFSNTQTSIPTVTSSTSTTTGCLVAGGGVGIAGQLHTGQDITVHTGNVNVTTGGINLVTFGGTPTLFNYYEEFNFSTVFTGAFTSVSQTFKITRIGNVVHLNGEELMQNTTAGATLVASTALPARFSPLSLRRYPIFGSNSATVTYAEIQLTISSSGFIVFSGVNGSLFITARAASGWGAFNVSYPVT